VPLLKVDLLTFLNNCKHVTTFLQNLDIDVLGVPDYVLDQCYEVVIARSKNTIVIPRAVFESSQNRLLPKSFELKTRLYTCVPKDLATARSLAKLGGIYTIALRADTIRLIDENEINLLTQVKVRKFIEVHLYSFIERLKHEDKRVSLERLLYFLSETIERALRRDVPVVVSSASPQLDQALHPNQIDVLLFLLGFTKRERRMMLEVYPMELLSTWREWR